MEGRCLCCSNFRTAGTGQSATDLPDGQISELPVQPSREIFFALLVGQIISTSSRHPVPKRGALAIVTNVGYGMRWTRQRRERSAIAGRVCRERLTGARTNGASTPSPKLRQAAHDPSERLVEVAAYGEVVWSWHPLLMSSRRRRSRPNRA